VLKLTNVESGYDLLKVLWGVDLHVEEGEFVAILGPNGAGKTTTLRSIAGFVPLAKGSITFRGRELRGILPHQVSRTGIGYVS
jgi:ABC-type branched-subunit amino acid transport system ATPase component